MRASCSREWNLRINQADLILSVSDIPFRQDLDINCIAAPAPFIAADSAPSYADRVDSGTKELRWYGRLEREAALGQKRWLIVDREQTHALGEYRDRKMKPAHWVRRIAIRGYRHALLRARRDEWSRRSAIDMDRCDLYAAKRTLQLQF